MRKYMLLSIILVLMISITGCAGSNSSNDDEFDFYKDSANSNSNSSYDNNSNSNNSYDNNSSSISNSNNQTVSTVIDIHDIKDANFYKENLNKKITITNVPVKYTAGEYTLGTLAVGVKCDNMSSLSLTDNSTISVTGVLSNSTTSNSYIRLSSCTLN